ncbi:MAG: 8-oxo-dGTP diphosphatase [Pseudomonadales bacterium]
MQSDSWHPDTDLRIERALQNWKPDLVGTLLFVVHEGHVLLIEKKTGHGAGKINGPGGKLEANETPEQCARRELREELQVAVQTVTAAATLRFIDRSGPQWLGYVFLGQGLIGTPTETAEAQPVWAANDALPLDRMWPDDRIWLPLILAGQQLQGDFLLEGERLVAHRWRPAAL